MNPNSRHLMIRDFCRRSEEQDLRQPELRDMSDELNAANAQMSSEQELATTAAVGAEETASSACPSSSKICHRRTDSAVPAAASEAAEGGVPDAENTPSSRMASATSQAQLQCDPPGVEGQNTATCSPSGSPQKSDSSPATVVATDDVSLPAASPDPSASDPGAKAENERVLRALRQDALGVLQSLAVVKRKLLWPWSVRIHSSRNCLL